MVQLTTGTAQGVATAAAVGGYHGLTTGSAAGDSTAAGKSTIILVQGSQVAVPALVDWGLNVRASQIAILTLGAKPAEYLFDTQGAVLSLTQQAAKRDQVSQASQLTLGNGAVMDQVSQVAQLALVRANPERRKLRAFTFDLDGHSFYVLHLGEVGTVVFDTVTRKWSEWKTQSFNNWRVGYATNWKDTILGGAIDTNMLYNVDPTQTVDDRVSPIVSTITGGYPTRLRVSFACDEIMVTSSVGWTQGGVSTMQLRTSDDFGLSWIDWGTQDFSTATPQTEVSWRSLGNISAPGRIFELTDIGAATRINSIEMYSRDIQDQPNG